MVSVQLPTGVFRRRVVEHRGYHGVGDNGGGWFVAYVRRPVPEPTRTFHIAPAALGATTFGSATLRR